MIVFHAEHTSSALFINTNHMKKIFLSLSLVASALVFDSCYKNPVTGRSSLNLVDEGTMMTMANQQYATFLSQNPAVPSTQSRDAEMVQRVGATRWYAHGFCCSVLFGTERTEQLALRLPVAV
jgi:hypothetical protein